MKPDNKNNVVTLSNDEPITKEAYEKLAKRFKAFLKHADHTLYDIRWSFDEAFTKHENSNPNSRKLKDFEVHEKRADANKETSKIKKQIKEELDQVEQGVLKYGVDIRDQEDESND
jgi:ribosome recycling factor